MCFVFVLLFGPVTQLDGTKLQITHIYRTLPRSEVKSKCVDFLNSFFQKLHTLYG